VNFPQQRVPPLQSELVIPLTGFVATQGDLRLAPVIVIGSLAFDVCIWDQCYSMEQSLRID
jgi:membrane protein DedA with SNARE-associated domain